MYINNDMKQSFFPYCYRRGPGQEYLKSTLGPCIGHVVDQDRLVLEINPLKVRKFHSFLY